MSSPSNAFRFIRPDGQFNVVRKGTPRQVWNDQYHKLLLLKWRWFWLLLMLLYVAINLAFATLYLLGGDCIAGARPGSFFDMVSFSVQTISTIGFGGLAPKTAYAHVIVSAEAFAGLCLTALSTGLIFAKFSRPTARVVFSQKAVVTRFNGKRVLSFRMANMRGNQLTNASLTVFLARSEVTEEGKKFRRFYDVPLMRERTAMFVLTWTAFHPLEESSPFGSFEKDHWEQNEVEVLVSLTGTDETFGQTISARHSYTWGDIVQGADFADMIDFREDGMLEVDYAHFDHLILGETKGT